jgi:hypothetical protein
MPSKTDYERKRKYKAREYRGERDIGGNIVYAGDHLLDKHLFVHRVAPGGFDWGPDADDDRACQLAIALLAPLTGVDDAVENYHLFAENAVQREFTGETWTVTRQDLRNPSHREQFTDREYPTNTAPSPEDVGDLEEIDLTSITYAEEIALAKKYDNVLWDRGNRRENLQRLTKIWAGRIDPAEDRVQRSHLYHMLSDVSSNARQTLATNFETMGDLAGWVCYGRNHSHRDGISEAAARQIRDARPAFIRYCGGEEYIPEYDGGCMSLDAVVVDDEQQTLGATE